MFFSSKIVTFVNLLKKSRFYPRCNDRRHLCKKEKAAIPKTLSRMHFGLSSQIELLPKARLGAGFGHKIKINNLRNALSGRVFGKNWVRFALFGFGGFTPSPSRSCRGGERPLRPGQHGFSARIGDPRSRGIRAAWERCGFRYPAIPGEFPG